MKITRLFLNINPPRQVRLLTVELLIKPIPPPADSLPQRQPHRHHIQPTQKKPPPRRSAPPEPEPNGPHSTTTNQSHGTASPRSPPVSPPMAKLPKRLF